MGFGYALLRQPPTARVMTSLTPERVTENSTVETAVAVNATAAFVNKTIGENSTTSAQHVPVDAALATAGNTDQQAAHSLFHEPARHASTFAHTRPSSKRT